MNLSYEPSRRLGPSAADGESSDLEPIRDMRAERIYLLWRLATQRHQDDDGRIQAILMESCHVLGMDIALAGEVDKDRYRVHFVYDPQQRVKAGLEMDLAHTPCQFVYAWRKSHYIDDLQANAQTLSMPVACQLNMQVYVGTPVWVGEHLWGVLAFMGTQSLEAARSAENIAFLEVIAAWLGQLLMERQQRLILENHALTDQLTRLPNRRAAEQRLRNELAQTKRREHEFTLALADLDHFKLINDRYGHEVGDDVLTGVAQFFESQLREEDWVARWGGEEFLFFLRTDDVTHGAAVVDRLRENLSTHPFATSAGALSVTLSAGVVAPGRDEASLNDLLAEADHCLYEAKRTGRDRVMSGKNFKDALRMAGVLRHATREKRVHVAYQDIVDLQDNFRVVADEALARVQTPEGSIIPASEFLGAAEGMHLMQEIDLEVSRQVFQHCARGITDASRGPGRVHFVNLSPQFLARRALVEEMLANAALCCKPCSGSPIPLKPVVFEITERHYFHDLEDVLSELQPLLDFGFRLALDDFGSGYSSLLYLAKLPVSFIKIEGWLVRDMREHAKARNIVRSLVAMAREQGIKTIAESVEDEATALLCQEYGVDWAQGFHFGHPKVDLGVTEIARPT
ncbi:MAG: putative bifunctional diguanylate cyclase/phosphodiesterase [Thiobacillaceae bacterium]